MFSAKTISTRAGLTLFLLLILLVVLLLARNTTLVRHTAYNLFHYLTGQETRLITANLEEINTPHYVIKYDPVDSAYAEMVGEAAEDAYGEVTQVFDRQPARKTTIIIYPDSSSLAQSFGWDKNEKALGVYWGGTIRILSPGAWLKGDDIKAEFSQQGPMVHELTHLLVDDITRGNYNRWWTEGIAQYVEKRTTGFEFSNPFNDPQDMQYYHFTTLTRRFDKLDQAVAYWQSLKAVEFISEEYGEDKLYAILESLGQQNTLDQAIYQTLGIDMNTFEQEFVQYIQQNC